MSFLGWSTNHRGSNQTLDFLRFSASEHPIGLVIPPEVANRVKFLAYAELPLKSREFHPRNAIFPGSRMHS